jgi:hypothetical protein
MKMKAMPDGKDDMQKDFLRIRNDGEQHAFAMLGLKTLFLCHLTMFRMEDHMYQLVVRAKLPDYAMQQYVAERKKAPQEIVFFLGNSAQDLMTVPELQTGARSRFLADIFRDIPGPGPDGQYQPAWPWKDVTPVIKGVPVTVERIVYFRHFDYNLSLPRDLSYVLFGSGDEAHITHYQVSEPDFDHVVSLAKAPDWLPPMQLEAGVPITILGVPNNSKDGCGPAGHKIYCSNPLTKESYPVSYAGYSCVGYPLYDDKGNLLVDTKIYLTHYCWFSTKVVNLMKDPCAEHHVGERYHDMRVRA